MARYDPYNDKISGCDEGSFIWLHEHGHQQLEHLIHLPSLTLAARLHFIIVCLLALALERFDLAKLAILVWLGIEISGELLAWGFAVCAWFYLKYVQKR